MTKRIKSTLILVLLSLVTTLSLMASAQSSTIASVIAADARLMQMNSAIQRAELQTLYNGTGPYTVFAPTDQAFAALNGIDANGLRQTLLHHTLQGNFSAAAISAETNLNTALGNSIAIQWDANGLALNGYVHLTVTDIAASNGTVHIVDAVLRPHSVSFFNTSAQSFNAETNAAGEEAPPSTAAAQPDVPAYVGDPSQNPAWVSGGLMNYWAGIHSDSHYCKGATFTVMRQMDGVVQVGADRRTNPYRGDSTCQTPLPVLCLNVDYSYPPASSAGYDYFDGWAFGNVAITVPFQMSEIYSRADANALCVGAFGEGWRVAEYHDANLGAKVGHISGHDFWAYGNLPVGERFWIAVNDQPANPWNSVNPKGSPPNIQGENVFLPGADPAFVGIGQARMTSDEGFAAGRGGCQGMTWALHKQINGKVQLGADHSTNPFVGDRSCDYRFPVLCINVVGWSAPGNSHGEDYSIGWSGGHVRASNAVSGHDINTRDKANAVCENTFGTGWRMAEWHDGQLGKYATDGWEMWAYGAMPLGLRYWVANNDQPANPWNQ